MLKTISIAFFVRALGSISIFLLTVIITKQLSASEAGYFFLAFATISILFPIGLFGSHTSSLRFISADFATKKWNEIQGTSIVTLLIASISSIFFSGIFWLFSPIIINTLWQKPEMQPIVVNIVLASVFMSLSTLIAHHLQAIRKIATSIVTLSIVIPLGASACIFLFDINTAFEASRWLLFVSALNLFLGYIFWWRSSTWRQPNYSNIKLIMKSCLPLWIITVMTALTLWGAQLIAGIWVESEEIAYLAAAQRTSMLVSFILISVNYVVAPRFAALYKQEKIDEFKFLAIKSVRIMLAFAIPAIIVIIFFSESIMSMFGNEYASASYLLVILAIGQLINVITGSVGYMLTMTGHEEDLRNVIIVSSTIAILLAIILCSLYGVIGAAIATAIGVSFQNLGAVWMVKKRFGFNILVIWKKSHTSYLS